MTDVTDLDERIRDAFRTCPETVVWHRRTTPGEEHAALAAACAELGVEDWDRYGDGGAVTRVEEQVAELLGKPAAVFFVSGTMAQQSMLRVWCERGGSRRVAVPDLSHLLVHEDDGPRLLHDLRFEHLTAGRVTPSAEALRALPHGLGAVLVELPLRDAGCLLPAWEDLVALAEAARELGVPLHADGARIWEAQPFWGRPLAEVAGLVDSMYVSFYKGLGAPAGAAVAGEQDVMDELRRWRQRMGGRLFRMTPYAVAALVGLRDRLPRMARYAEWARAFAAELEAVGLRVNPSPPHVNTFEVFAESPLPELQERWLSFVEREKVLPSGPWVASPVPGVSVTEVACYDPALTRDPAEVARWYAEIAGG